MSLGPTEPKVIIFERSPYGNLDAIVEHDGRAIYFYLSNKELGTKACWLGNLIVGPMVINENEMKQGIPPVLPRIHCNHPEGREIPTEEDLEIVWFEEGNGAAVRESGKILGIIPPWSGVDGFHGYARDCLAETSVAWPMPDTQSMERRVNLADSFWKSLASNPFSELQKSLLEIYEGRWGKEQKYWSIDGDQFPPKGLVQLENDGTTTFATVGMSLVPQPGVEMYVENPSLHRRVELGFQIDSTQLSDSLVGKIGQQMSGLAQMPWRNLTWLGHRHTCELNLETLPDSMFALCWVDEKDGKISHFRDDPVNLLWLIPINEKEMESLRNRDDSFIQTEDFQRRLPH